IFPTVTVTLINEASHSVYLKCGFDEGGEYKGLQKMEPGDSITWSFVELIFPLRWCYVHIDEENYGAFWAFTVFLQCRDCKWIIRDDGAYHFNHFYGEEELDAVVVVHPRLGEEPLDGDKMS
ncbi:hypothetical protein Gotur_004001, partial [Gossypium turneri]